MKVEISIPAPVFEAAERMSRRMRISRSRFYAKAVEAYTKARLEDDITKRLNNVYGTFPSRLDPALEATSLEVLRRER